VSAGAVCANAAWEHTAKVAHTTGLNRSQTGTPATPARFRFTNMPTAFFICKAGTVKTMEPRDVFAVYGNEMKCILILMSRLQ
jgi:hypothetical protein